jgi:alpha-galactosidase
VEVYRKGLALCREVVGEERTLLGCGAPIGPSIGLVDAMRVSEDVKEEWNSLLASFAGRGCGYPSARGSIANNVHRAFTHGRWWRNDPDGLIVRAHDSRLAPDEVETHATVLGMSGGLVFLNDDLTRLEPERLHLAEGLLPPCARPAFAREGLAEEFPPLLEIEGDLARGAGTVAGAPRRLLAFLNLGESWVERSVPEGVIGGSFFDFWREEMASVLRPGSDLSRSPRIVVPPRGVRALLWTPWLGRPALVGGSFHLTALVDGRMREFFSEEGGDGLALLHVECDALARSRGRLWLGVPARYGLLVDRLPRGVSVKEILPSRSVLDVDLAPPFSFDLLFATIGPSEGVR